MKIEALETFLEVEGILNAFADLGLHIPTAFRYLRELFENNNPILGELKALQYIEKKFGKRFHKNKKTPDFISEDKKIGVEVKSTKKRFSKLEDLLKFWLIGKKEGGRSRLRQLGKLILLKEQGMDVYVAIYCIQDDSVVLYSLDELIKHLPQKIIEKAKKYETNKLYHKPSIVHYYGAWLFDKDLGEISKEDLEKARKQLIAIVRKYWDNPAVKRTKIGEILAKNELREMYIRFPKAPRGYLTFKRLLDKEKL